MIGRDFPDPNEHYVIPEKPSAHDRVLAFLNEAAREQALGLQDGSRVFPPLPTLEECEEWAESRGLRPCARREER